MRKYLILMIVLYLGATAVKAENTIIPSFTAHYDLKVKGINAGKGVIELSYKDLQYHLKMQGESGGLAALFTDIEFMEQVVGRYEAGKLLPQEYVQSQQLPKGKSQLTWVFDWQNQQAIFSGIDRKQQKRQATVILQGHELDPLSLLLQVMQDLQTAQLQTSYTVMHEGESKTYLIQAAQPEKLKTSLGQLNVQKVTQQREGSSRRTHFWFADTLHYLPVKVEQTNRDKNVFTMVLTQVEVQE